MDFWLSQIPRTILIAIGSLTLVFFLRYQIAKTDRKAKDDRVLLKELLERFDLDVPAELKESEGVQIKTIESN